LQPFNSLDEHIKAFKKEHSLGLPTKFELSSFSKEAQTLYDYKHTVVLNRVAKAFGYKKFNDLKPVIAKRDYNGFLGKLHHSIVYSSLDNIFFMREIVSIFAALARIGKFKKSEGILIINDEYLPYSFKRFKPFLAKNEIDWSLKIKDTIEALHTTVYEYGDATHNIIEKIDKVDGSTHLVLNNTFSQFLCLAYTNSKELNKEGIIL